MIPLYFDLRSVGLTDSYWSLILPQTAQSMAFGIFWMRNFIRSVPLSISEAARLDGASDAALLWRVLVPIARPPDDHGPARRHVDLERVSPAPDHDLR